MAFCNMKLQLFMVCFFSSKGISEEKETMSRNVMTVLRMKKKTMKSQRLIMIKMILKQRLKR